MSKQIYILGSKGHARVVRDIIDQMSGYEFAAFINEKDEQDFIEDHKGREQQTYVALGIGENFIRKTLYQRFSDLGYQFPVIQSSTAIISKDTKIKDGAVIGAGVIINTGAHIGISCVINSGAIIEHDVALDDYATAAPSAVICGGCDIGKGAYIGANATIVQGLSVGAWAVLGAGAVLVENLAENSVAVSVPAKVIKTKTPETPIF